MSRFANRVLSTDAAHLSNQRADATQGPDERKPEHRRPLRLRLPTNAALAPNIGCCNALLGAYVRAEIPQWQKVRAPAATNHTRAVVVNKMLHKE